MNKLAVIVPFWKRKELTNLCFKNLSKQSKKFGFDVFVSGDDKSLSDKYNFNFIDIDNNPVSQKNNTLIKACKGYDGVVLIGSDNFISDSIFELYGKIDLSTPVMYGFDNLHFYEVSTKILATECVYKNQSIGVGRLFSKPLLEELNHSPWIGIRNSGLDTNCSNNLKSKGLKETILNYANHFILDVKHEYNITDHSIINLCNKVCDLSLLKEYPYILKLKESKNQKTMKNKKKLIPNKKVEIEFIKDVLGVSKGSKRVIKLSNANELARRGLVKITKEIEPTNKSVSAEYKPTLKELRIKYPNIKATSVKTFLEKLNG